MTKIFKYIRNIHYYETDCMGITHHSNYVRIFEEARIDFMKKIDLAYDRLENLGIIIPVTGIDLEYKNVSKFAQVLRFESAIVYFTGVRMTVQYKVFDNETDELICTGHTKHAFVDQNFQPFALQKKFPEIWQKFQDWNLHKDF
ncbi:MAG TPA: acyl-CoA thioesterase [Clostridiaceae bacterium]|nr:acyl-CoA thioesterase [Clostridiaceae bacterium]